MDYSCIVFDTAPTGHTLRLLQFPSTLEKGLQKVMSLKSKFGGLIGQVCPSLLSSITLLIQMGVILLACLWLYDSWNSYLNKVYPFLFLSGDAYVISYFKLFRCLVELLFSIPILACSINWAVVFPFLPTSTYLRLGDKKMVHYDMLCSILEKF